MMRERAPDGNVYHAGPNDRAAESSGRARRRHAVGPGTLLEQATHALTRVSGTRYNNTDDRTPTPAPDLTPCA
jgi:hypothetical protein